MADRDAESHAFCDFEEKIFQQYCKQVANEEQYMKISSGVRDLAVKDVTSFKGDEWKYDMSPRCKKVT
jgi:hypothetical protein